MPWAMKPSAIQNAVADNIDHDIDSRPQKSGGGGMGMAGGAALGLGAGVIGGALVADAWNDHEQEAYAEGYNDGNDGDDFGGGDDF
ncbi:WW domain protein [Apiospora marii]|uniref:WW domain protein n=2 Tax=Apiospora marii TaxID=335849 RepID=A0ABR1RCM7_9PEZI